MIAVITRFRLAAAGLVLLALAWGGYLWARDLSLFRVRHVQIEGLSSREAPAIRRALRETARRMTTLHVRQGELRKSVSAFQVVQSVSASADFPHTLHVKVNEYQPVAALTGTDGRRVAVSSVATLLRSVGPKAKLPVVKVDSVPTAGRLEDASARRLVSVLAGAPRPLRPQLERAYDSPRGVTIVVRDGPVLYFGAPSRITAKWAAASRVLADSGSRGARFIDVRLPERPAASGFGAGDTGPPV